MQDRVGIAALQCPSPFPRPPSLGWAHAIYATTVSIAASVVPLVVLVCFTREAAASTDAAAAHHYRQFFIAFVAVCLTAALLALAFLEGVFRQRHKRMIATLTLTVDRVTRTYTDGAALMFDIDTAVARVLSHTWRLPFFDTATRLDLYVMHSAPADALGSVVRAVYTRDQVERTWPRLFTGSTSQQGAPGLFDRVVCIPMPDHVGTLSVYKALHSVDDLAYALDAGVAAQMAGERLIKSRREGQARLFQEQRQPA